MTTRNTFIIEILSLLVIILGTYILINYMSYMSYHGKETIEYYNCLENSLYSDEDWICVPPKGYIDVR